MNHIALISAAATLLIAVLIYSLFGFRLKRPSASALLLVFVLGFASIIFNILSYYFTARAGIIPLGTSIKKVAFYSLVTAGFAREFGKFLVVRFAGKPRSDFNNPADGIVFALMTSLGFTFAALVWNIAFPNIGSAEMYRNLLTLPANIITAIILGFFIGLGEMRTNRFIDTMTGLAAATIFHAVFEFCLITLDLGLIAIVFGGSIIIVAILIKKAIDLSLPS
jgi:RsiW-degrading membrane proteinase PrsW (M82 family)